MSHGTWAAALLLAGSVWAGEALECERKTFLRGDRAAIRLHLDDPKGKELRLRGTTVPGTWRLAIPRDGTLALDTGLYRVGDYQLSLREKGQSLSTLDLYVRSARRPEVWFGNFTDRPARSGGDPFQDLRDLGMNAAYLYGNSPDDALRHGVYLVFHGNALRGCAPKDQQQKLRMVIQNARGATKPAKMSCMRNPEVIRLAAEKIVGDIRGFVRYPGFLGVGLDDEVSMRVYDWNDTGGVTCYCDSCRRLWKQKTGQEPPRPAIVAPGTIVPDDAPYLNYMLNWTGWADYYGPAEAAYNQTLARRVHELRPDLLVFQTPGAAFGELDAVHWEIYSYWLSSPATGALAAMSRVRALQLEAYGGPKPVWPLIGWFARRPAPRWTGAYIEAQSRMCMAEGAKAIWLTLMYWYDSRGHFKDRLLYGAEHLAPSVRAVGAMLERFGPALIRIEPTRYPVAVLYSKTTEGYQRVIDPEAIAAAKARGSWLEVAWQHGQATSLGFAALLRAGLPAEFITEDDVLAGRLKDYAALVLLDHQFARRSVADRIQAYASGGGRVYADRGSPIRPKEATVLPFDAAQFTRMVNLGLRAARVPGERLDIVLRRTTGLEREWALLLRQRLANDLPEGLRTVASSNQGVIVRQGRSGTTDYVFVLSADVFGEQTAVVSARTGGAYAYDLLAGEAAPLAAVGGELRLRATLPPGGWKVYAVTERPLGDARLTASLANGTVTLGLEVRDTSGGIVAGAFPIRIDVAGPKGEPLPYGGHFGTDAGRLAHAFRPATNDPTGRWTLRATNLATGQVSEAAIEVKR